MKNSLLLFLTLLIIACRASADSSVTIESETEVQRQQLLLNEVTNLLAQLQTMNVRIVGALPHSVVFENQPNFPKRAGAFNYALGQETQRALVFANPATVDAVQQFGVVADVSESAETLPGAKYVESFEAREALFKKPYKLAWKVDEQDTAVPDALILGHGIVHEDLNNIDLELRAIIKGREEMLVGTAFTAPLTTTDIELMGLNHVVADATGKTNEEIRQAARRSAQASRTKAEDHPLHPNNRSTTPVALDVYYGTRHTNAPPRKPDDPDDFKHYEWKVMPIQIVRESKFEKEQSSDFGAFLPEPKTGQRLLFVIRKNEAQKGQRLGILLRVNGENSLLKQRGPDAQCRIWVMEEEQDELVIGGYQMKLGKDGISAAFVATSPDESRNLTTFFGNHVGLISLVVFADDTSKKGSKLNPQPYQKLLAIKHGELRGVTDNKFAAREHLIDEVLGPSKPRGIIMPDAESPLATKATEFTRTPSPILSATIRYYQP